MVCLAHGLRAIGKGKEGLWEACSERLLQAPHVDHGRLAPMRTLQQLFASLSSAPRPRAPCNNGVHATCRAICQFLCDLALPRWRRWWWCASKARHHRQMHQQRGTNNALWLYYGSSPSSREMASRGWAAAAICSTTCARRRHRRRSEQRWGAWRARGGLCPLRVQLRQEAP